MEDLDELQMQFGPIAEEEEYEQQIIGEDEGDDAEGEGEGEGEEEGGEEGEAEKIEEEVDGEKDENAEEEDKIAKLEGFNHFPFNIWDKINFTCH